MRQRTVLVVEDEFLIRMALADALADDGHLVVEAGSVLEAVAALGRHNVDAVVTDIDLPGGLSGLDLAKMASSTNPGIDLIVTSGGHCANDEDLPVAARFIPKPYDVRDIKKMLNQVEKRRLAG